MAHANAVTGASIYFDESMPLPEDSYFDPDGWPLATVPRPVGPGLLMEAMDPDIQVGDQ